MVLSADGHSIFTLPGMMVGDTVLVEREGMAGVEPPGFTVVDVEVIVLGELLVLRVSKSEKQNSFWFCDNTSRTLLLEAYHSYYLSFFQLKYYQVRPQALQQ